VHGWRAAIIGAMAHTTVAHSAGDALPRQEAREKKAPAGAGA
jgi:hypothetical protein